MVMFEGLKLVKDTINLHDTTDEVNDIIEHCRATTFWIYAYGFNNFNAYLRKKH